MTRCVFNLFDTGGLSTPPLLERILVEIYEALT
jgi:hypothetical protein